MLGGTGSGTGSGSGNEQPRGAKVFGHVRLGVSCGELVLVAVEWLQLLCEELLREGEVMSVSVCKVCRYDCVMIFFSLYR